MRRRVVAITVLAATLGLPLAPPATAGMPVSGCPPGWVLLEITGSETDRNGDGMGCTRGAATIDNVADESATQKPPKMRH